MATFISQTPESDKHLFQTSMGLYGLGSPGTRVLGPSAWGARCSLIVCSGTVLGQGAGVRVLGFGCPGSVLGCPGARAQCLGSMLGLLGCSGTYDALSWKVAQRDTSHSILSHSFVAQNISHVRSNLPMSRG